MAKKKYARTRIIAMDDVYRLLNRVQIDKKEVTFAVKVEEAAIAENIVKDVGLEYTTRKLKTRTDLTVYPDPDDNIGEEIEIDVDFLDDEIVEDGQIF